MDKYRYWWFILYPDSAPLDWISILADTFCKICISPLHDSDVDDKGNPKKPHYHVLVCYDGPTTSSCIQKHFTTPLNTVFPKYVLSPSGAFAYLTHLNSPGKYKYNAEDIIYLNGACPSMFDLDVVSASHYETIEGIIFDKKPLNCKSLLSLIYDIGDTDLLLFFRKNVYYFKCLL